MTSRAGIDDGIVPRSRSFIGSDGQQVAVHDFGGRGEALLIAHAAGFCGRAYAPMIARLVDRFRVWALDLRGHGDSPAPAGGDYSWEGMARDVLTAVSGLATGPVLFFGHSLGGAAGMRAESLAPGTLSSIYVYEPAVLPPIDGIGVASSAMGKLARQRRSVFASREEAFTRLSSRPPFDTMSPESLWAYITHGTRSVDGASCALKCAPADEAAVYEAADKITVAEVASIAVPVVIGIGMREYGLPAVAAPLILSSLADARSESYPELGHLGPFEDPAGVADRVSHHFSRRRTVR